VGADYQLELWNQVLVEADHAEIRVRVGGSTTFSSTGMEIDGRLTSADLALDRPARLSVHVKG
jgi:predicted nucleotidyltransferase